MARDFDGAGDNISFGSDASVDSFSTKAIYLWTNGLATPDGANDTLVAKSDGGAVAPTGWKLGHENTVLSTGHLRFRQDWGITDGDWMSADNSFPANELHHAALVYSRADTGQDPLMFRDGTSLAIVELSAPTGATQGDAAANLRLGQQDNLGGDVIDGTLGFFTFNDADGGPTVNRHRWYGTTPGGPSTTEVWHPMWSTDLTNKGTATANGTATGTTSASIPRAERMWGSLMGIGR